MAEVHAGALAHHFESTDQQNRAASFGMWAFLVQEVMFFGGLFTTYLVYRGMHSEAFIEGSHHLPVAWGTLNTAVLIGSSLTMALAVRSAQIGKPRHTAAMIASTMALAAVFLGVKAIEYSGKYADGLIPGLHWAPGPDAAPDLNVFYTLYFIMTGMHALHMIVGLGLMVVVASRALRGRYSPQNYIGVEVLGLYWHFVDLVWIFLFPLLYLIGRH